MKKVILILVVLLSQVVFSQNDFPSGKLISLVDLSINPQKYYGQKITVKGYLSLNKEAEGIFFNENDPQHGIFINGIGVYGINIGALDKKYVILSGTFKKEVVINKRVISSNMFNGYIMDVTFIEDLDKFYNKR